MEYHTEYFYAPHREDECFKLYRSNGMNYLAVHPNVYAPGIADYNPHDMSWRLYPWTKQQTTNFVWEWGVNQHQSKMLKALDTDKGTIVDPCDAAKELLDYARIFVAKEREREWNKKYPYDAFFEIVHDGEKKTFSLALKSTNADPLVLLPIIQYPEYDDRLNKTVKWSIDRTRERTVCTLPSMSNVPYLRKHYVSQENLNVCREEVKKMVKKNWYIQHPEHRKYQICIQKKSFYYQIVNKFPNIRFEKLNQVNVLNPNKEERAFVQDLFQPDRVPRDLYIHLLKETYGTFLAFCPKSVENAQMEWWVYQMNGAGTMMTSVFEKARHLGSFRLREKWFWSNLETFAMARDFLKIVHGKKSL